MHRRLHELSERFKHVIERNSISSQRRRKLLRDFADEAGLIYFGQVDQHQDDHRTVRGFTASHTHEDNSYISGTYDERDIAIVDRFDIKFQDDHTYEKHRWVVFEFQLKSADHPHLFLAPKDAASKDYNKIFTAYRYLDHLNITADAEFNSRYALFGSPAHLPEAEVLVSGGISQVFAAHFWPFALEIFEDSLYVYSGDKNLSHHDLETIIKNGTWFSQVLDSVS